MSANNTPRPAPTTFAGLTLDAGPHLMGIINVTPDSFSDGGNLGSTGAAVEHGLRLEDEGATILDVGGESTRPGAEPVARDEERRRVLPVIEQLAARSAAVLSIDTRNAPIMREARAAGARIINDVSALTHDPDALGEAIALANGEKDSAIVLMHAGGDPRTMQDNPHYEDVIADVRDYLAQRVALCRGSGVAPEQLAIDPGIGFGKTAAHNLALLAHLEAFHGLGTSLLVGASRKRFIGKIANEPDAARRAPGSIACALAAARAGVQLIRVHDVRETAQALAVWKAIRDASRRD